MPVKHSGESSQPHIRFARTLFVRWASSARNGSQCSGLDWQCVDVSGDKDSSVCGGGGWRSCEVTAGSDFYRLWMVLFPSNRLSIKLHIWVMNVYKCMCLSEWVSDRLTHRPNEWMNELINQWVSEWVCLWYVNHCFLEMWQSKT